MTVINHANTSFVISQGNNVCHKITICKSAIKSLAACKLIKIYNHNAENLKRKKRGTGGSVPVRQVFLSPYKIKIVRDPTRGSSTAGERTITKPPRDALQRRGDLPLSTADIGSGFRLGITSAMIARILVGGIFSPQKPVYCEPLAYCFYRACGHRVCILFSGC